MLRDTFTSLVNKYTDSNQITDQLWSEIEKNYSASNRHYHNLTHLEDLYKEISEVKEEIIDWEITLFTLYYHDIIYNASKSNNEEKSAEFASARLQELGISADKVEACHAQIIATKLHNISPSSDINLFNDADLSILGRDWDTYKNYFQNVRKEYSIYPMFLYKRGRKKVLKHFLEMDQIFKTVHFASKYESQARVNLQKELTELSK